ncbi:MAG: hypothetical protein QG602_403, partial [Verrucomicrobiota bacterium]|nr:hypothetical protein [Verrucomicrobiota bacterium]
MSVRYRRRQAVPTNRMGHFEGSNVPLLFSALDVDSGIFNLTSDLTLNGQTVAPTFRYEGLSASVASWPAIVGNTLPTFSAGTDPTIGDLTPFTKAGESSVYFQAGKGYQYTNNTYADITDDNADVVFE